MAERRHFDIHKGIERQGGQNAVEFGGVLYIEDADVHIPACDAPEMQPLPLQLQLLGAVVLLGLQVLNLLGVTVARNTNVDAYMEQHVESSRLTVAAQLPVRRGRLRLFRRTARLDAIGIRRSTLGCGQSSDATRQEHT